MKHLWVALLLTGCDRVASLDYYHSNEAPPIVAKVRPADGRVPAHTAPPEPTPVPEARSAVVEPPPPAPTASFYRPRRQRQQEGHATAAVKQEEPSRPGRWWQHLFPWWDRVFR